MNDPGLDDAVADEAGALDQPFGRQDSQNGENQAPVDHRHPEAARWWLASTAYPLTAGTFGPMASAFNICSLAQTWRMQVQPGGGAVNIADPKWVIGLNALSLICAVVANLVLSLNMTRRIRFEVAQPIIIIGWYISSVLLIGLLIAFRVVGDVPTSSGHVFSQAYFYGAYAAVLYFVISSLLVVTAYGAYRGHYSREYKLTTSQRTLMLQTIIFFFYLLGGAAVYARVEDWRFLDAVYFADYTLLTIGVGNYAPITHLGRGLLFPYAIGGIVILGLIISSIRTLTLEKGRQKMADVLTSRTRRFLVKQAYSDKNAFNRIVPRLGKEAAGAEGRSSREQRKQEFIVMRQVRQLATVQHKWISLIISVVLWMALWLLGAVVFWRSEADRHWTYFEALYFAYISLLTIGYGDLYPNSSFGRSFFVFWSLLAVPSITILISNIGDTLVRFLRDVTIFLGEITILPGDQSFGTRIKGLIHTSWIDKWIQETTGEKAPAEAISDVEANNEDRNSIEVEEHKKEESARQRGDLTAENIHHYHYMLFREVRKMMEYATSNLSKEFDYLEWEYYLGLISGKDKPLEDGETEEENERDPSRNWSWIDGTNPLLGQKTEVEWLLNALTEVLERELKKASRGYHSPEASERKHNHGDSEGSPGNTPQSEKQE
ncbi:hypothetical protein N7474_005899 [Penicillium riverlandense]|uniref:uncharacterized protein n=1 Tax=Penicillium riverlandense TaxID=1903569 RepID=UPI002546AF26|nr:uncharacterized protein N7474_005899 [Penicillium riverlandense]KAJ5820308.1 hypothetical protein N7474_005899 [Penicillium riverlandense]